MKSDETCKSVVNDVSDEIAAWAGRDGLKTKTGVKIFKSPERDIVRFPTNPNTQYYGLYWIHLYFSDELVRAFDANKVKKTIGFIPSGINILPWRIFRSDIVDSEAEDKSQLEYNIVVKSFSRRKPRCIKELRRSTGKYKDIVKQNQHFVDFDPDTGNIHKKVNNLWQIVLTESGSDAGPMYEREAEHFIDAINFNAYTPEIAMDKDDEDYSVDELIRLVFKKLNIRVKDDLI